MEASRQILLVEDNEDDVLLFQRALKKAGVSNQFQIAEHGQQAIDYLSGHGKFSNRAEFPIPNFVFLDLKMPYKGGLEVLKWMRQNQTQTPDVFILTSSAEARDVNEAQRLNACAYFLKPIAPETLKQIYTAVTCLSEYPGDIFQKLPDEGLTITKKGRTFQSDLRVCVFSEITE